MEYSKQLKDEGVGVTVMRSGKYKALANSVEPLSDAAKAQIQSQLDAAYKVFVNHVAASRGVSYEVADSQMAQGREFFGVQSVDAGLVDGIRTFDQVFGSIQDSIDNSDSYSNNRAQKFNQPGFSGSLEVNGMAGSTLTDAQIAALAAGATEETQEATTESTQEAAASTEEAAPAAPESQADNSQLVSYLQAQVKERDADLVASKVQLATLTEKLASAEAVLGDLTAIAAKSLNNMQIALGGSAMDYSAMAPLNLIAEHKRVSATFTTKFKAGGVAAVDAAVAEKEANREVRMTNIAQAQLNALRGK